jgi:hypothetical protein
MSASESNLTRLKAGDVGGLHPEDRHTGKTCWRGWQPQQIRFGHDIREMKPEVAP